jgi:hypothetical protein
MFDMLKNLMGVFEYRFWTKWLPDTQESLGKTNI